MQETRRRGSPWQPKEDAYALHGPASETELDTEALEEASGKKASDQSLNQGVQPTSHHRIAAPVVKSTARSAASADTTSAETKPADTKLSAKKPGGDYQDARAKLSTLNQEARVREDARRAERLAEAKEHSRQRKAELGREKAGALPAKVPDRKRDPGKRDKRTQAERPRDTRPKDTRPRDRDNGHPQRRSDAREREVRMARIQNQQRGNFISRLRQRLQRKEQEEEEERRTLLDKLQDARLERQRRKEQLELAKAFRADRDKLERRNRVQAERYQTKGRRSKQQPDRSREQLAKRMKVRADAKLAEERTRMEKRYREERARIERKYRERRAKLRNKAQGNSPSAPNNRVQKVVKMLRGRVTEGRVQRLRLRRFRLRRLRFRRERIRRQRVRLDRDRRLGLGVRRTRRVQTQRQQRVQLDRQRRQRQTRQRQTRQLQQRRVRQDQQRRRTSRERRVRQDRQRQQRVRQDHSRRARQDRTRRDRDRRGGW